MTEYPWTDKSKTYSMIDEKRSILEIVRGSREETRAALTALSERIAEPTTLASERRVMDKDFKEGAADLDALNSRYDQLVENELRDNAAAASRKQMGSGVAQADGQRRRVLERRILHGRHPRAVLAATLGL